MPYHSTSGTATNTADFWVQMRDFLTSTVGWTQTDTSSTFDVFHSTGESGQEAIYLQLLEDSNTTRLQIRGHLFWNATTHQGVKSAYHASNCYIRVNHSGAFLYWIYADLDHWFVVTKHGSTYYGQYSGIINRFWSSNVGVTQAIAASGSQVVVPIDDASHFEASRPYMIHDNANIERVTISAVDTSTTPQTVTLESLPLDFAAGARVGEDPQPVIVGRYVMPGSFYALNDWDGWSSTAGMTGDCKKASGGAENSACPDRRYGLTTMFPWLVFHTTTANQELRGQLIEVYAVGSSGLDSEDVIEQGGQTFKVFNLSTSGYCAVKE